jgi:hypothetical protein
MAEAALKRILASCLPAQEAFERRLSFQVGAIEARRRANRLREAFASSWREAVARGEAP